jgi:hypothetical protein
MTTKMLAPALGAFLVLLTGVGTAEADGMQQPRTAEAQRCIGGPFAGPYIGVNAGYGRVETTQSSTGDPSAKGDDHAFTAGGQVGYNWQCGHVVFGLEADFNSVGFETNTASTSGPPPLPSISRTSSTGSERCVAGSASQSTNVPLSTRRVVWLMPTPRANSQSHPFHSARLTMTSRRAG